MIVIEHVTVCLAEQPPDRAQLGQDMGGGGGPGGGGGGEEQNHQESGCCISVPINSIINFEKNLCVRRQKKNQSLCPTNLCDGPYKRDEKNETTKPTNGFLVCLLPRLVPAMTPGSLCGYSSSQGKMML